MGGAATAELNVWLHARNLTERPNMAMFKGIYLLQTIILGIHVSVRGCIFIFSTVAVGIPFASLCKIKSKRNKNMCWTHPTQYWERVTTSFIIIILCLFSRATCEKSNILSILPWLCQSNSSKTCNWAPWAQTEKTSILQLQWDLAAIAATVPY